MSAKPTAAVSRLDGDVFRSRLRCRPANQHYADDLLHKPRRVDGNRTRAPSSNGKRSTSPISRRSHYAEAIHRASRHVDLGGIRTISAYPLLKENELIGAILLYAKRFARSPTSRLSWSGTLPHRPSSPSRTRGCLTSCANPSSSRLLLPTCSRSSAARPSTCRQYCKPSLIGGSAL